MKLPALPAVFFSFNSFKNFDYKVKPPTFAVPKIKGS
jgi:hypothetical protein